MIIFLNTDGTIFATTAEPVRQGASLTNKIYVVAPISNASILRVAFQLPNGVLTSKYLCSVSQAIDVVPLSTFAPEAQGHISYWSLNIPEFVTQLSGSCVGQLYIEDNSNVIASDNFTFQIERGVASVPTTLEEGDLDTILSAFNNAISMVLYFQGKSPVIDSTGATQGDLIEYDGTEVDPAYGVTTHKVKSAGIASADVPLDFDVTTNANNASVVTPKNKDGDDLTPFTIENTKTAKADEQNSRIPTTYVRDVTVNVLGNHHTTLGIKRKKVDNGTLVDDIVSKLIPSVFQAFVDSHNADLSAKLNNLDISDDLLHLVGKRSNGNDMQISVIDLIAQTLINYYSLDNSKTLKENIASVFASESRDITQKGNLVVQGNGGFQGNVQIGGSLNVAGRVISEDVEYLNVKDRIIALNYGIADNTALAGIAIITSAVDSTHFNAFGIMFDPNESHLGSSVVGGFGVLEKTTSGGNDVYRFTFNNGQSHPLALRDGLVDGNLVKYDGATHTLTDSGKSVDDLYYEGKTQGAEGEVVGVDDQGKIGLITMADPVLNKYFTPTAVTPKVIDYYGAFSVQFSAFPTNATQIRVAIGSTYNFDLILDDTPEIEEFAVYYNGNPIYTNQYVETGDGKIYCDFSVYDLSAYVSFNLLRNLDVALSVTYTGADNPTYALKGYLSAKVLDYVLTQIYANDDTKLDKVTGASSYNQCYVKRYDGSQLMINYANSPETNAIMSRDSNGRSQVEAPSADKDIVNKKYTDDADSALVFGIVDGD